MRHVRGYSIQHSAPAKNPLHAAECSLSRLVTGGPDGPLLLPLIAPESFAYAGHLLQPNLKQEKRGSVRSWSAGPRRFDRLLHRLGAGDLPTRSNPHSQTISENPRGRGRRRIRLIE